MKNIKAKGMKSVWTWACPCCGEKLIKGGNKENHLRRDIADIDDMIYDFMCSQSIAKVELNNLISPIPKRRK